MIWLDEEIVLAQEAKKLEGVWIKVEQVKSELLPEWVKLTITVPKLTGSIEGTSWWTAEGDEKERLSEWRAIGKYVCALKCNNYSRSTVTAFKIKIKWICIRVNSPINCYNILITRPTVSGSQCPQMTLIRPREVILALYCLLTSLH